MTDVDFSGRPLGRAPARSAQDIPTWSELTTALAPPPAKSNWFFQVQLQGDLGNDRFGDCVEAAICNGALQRTTYAGSAVTPTEQDALGLYARVTGFDPATGANDNGTIMAQAMRFMRLNGWTIGGRKDQYLGVARLDPMNLTAIMQAVDLCATVYFGVDFRAEWFKTRIWGRSASPVEGGHCIAAMGYERIGQDLAFTCATWGEFIQLDKSAFAQGDVSEAWVIADLDFIEASGRDPAGVLQPQYIENFRLLKAA